MRWYGCLVLAGCVNTATEIEIVEGSATVHPNDQIQFRAVLPGGATIECGGHWLVNAVEGGSMLFGRIDACGHYVAPAAFPAGLVELEVEGTFPGRGDCLDCTE